MIRCFVVITCLFGISSFAHAGKGANDRAFGLKKGGEAVRGKHGNPSYGRDLPQRIDGSHGRISVRPKLMGLKRTGQQLGDSLYITRMF